MKIKEIKVTDGLEGRVGIPLPAGPRNGVHARLVCVGVFTQLVLFCFLLFTFSCFASAQTYSVDYYKIAGGGGTSTGGVYQVSGTLGQPDVAASMSGGIYSLTGGFWSLIQVIQTAGLSNLTLTHGGNSVTISWPATGSYTLQQNANLANQGGWVGSGLTVTTANGISSVTIKQASGNLFFRLSSP